MRAARPPAERRSGAFGPGLLVRIYYICTNTYYGCACDKARAPHRAQYECRSAMAYRCRRCGATFTRGSAFKLHQRVHAPAPGVQSRARFPGTEPYDAADYPARALAPPDDGGDGGGGGSSGGDEDLVPQPAVALAPATSMSVEEEIRLRLCELKANGAAGSGLSEADMSNILRIVALATNADRAALFRNCDDLSRHMLELVSRHPDLAWYIADVRAPSFPAVPPAKIIYRNLEDMLVSMVRTLDIKWGFWNFETTQAGERIYDHPCSGELFEAVCKLLEGTGTWALALQLWSDKAELTKRGSKSYYPLSCVLLPVLFDLFREQWPDSAIAFLPIIERGDVPPSMTDREFYLYKAEIEAAALERVLFPVFSAHHVFSCVDSKGVSRSVVAVLHSWVTDFMEQIAVAGLIGQSGCAMCDVAYEALLPDPEASDEDEARPRTARDILSNVQRMKAAWAASRVTEFDHLRRETRLQGCVPILVTLFERGLVGKAVEAGFINGIVPASVMPLDTLHVFDEGWGKRLVNAISHHVDACYGKAIGSWLTDTLNLRLETALDMAFIEETSWPNPSKVFRGRRAKQEGCSGLQACEMRALYQLLPTMLHGIVGVRGADGAWQPYSLEADYLTDMMCAYVNYYMELKRYNRRRGHTDNSLELLEHLGHRFLRILRSHFLEDQASGFATPKAHQGFGNHVPATIRLLGATNWLSTEWGENSVKSGHAAYEATNKNRNTAEDQMAAHLAKRAAARRELAVAGLSVAPAGLGTRRTARRVAQSTGVNQLALQTVSRVALADFSADPLPLALEDRPGMASFPRELERFLTAEDIATAVDWVDVVHSAALNSKLAHHPDEYMATVTMTVYAAPSFRRRRRLSFVAFEGVGEDNRLEEWIAQLLLLFRLPDGTQLAYVQFLVADPQREGRGPLFGQPNCAPLTWERIGADARYSYAVTHLDKLIRREFVVPDLNNVFAPRRLRQRREDARARKARRYQESDNDSSSNSESDADVETSADSDSGEDVALEPAKDGVERRWPIWIRNPFVWGW